jgi:hypothetical protein
MNSKTVILALSLASPLAFGADARDLGEDVLIEGSRSLQGCVADSDPSAQDKAQMLLMGALADHAESSISGIETVGQGSQPVRITQHSRIIAPAQRIDFRKIDVMGKQYVCAFSKRVLA